MPAVPLSKVQTFQEGLAEVGTGAYQRLRNNPRFMAAVAAAAAAARLPSPEWTTNTLQTQQHALQGDKSQGSPAIMTTEEDAEGKSLSPLITAATAGSRAISGRKTYERRQGKGPAESSASATYQDVFKEPVFDVPNEAEEGKQADTVHERNRKRPRTAAASVLPRGQRPATAVMDEEGKGKSCSSGGSGHVGAGDVVWMPWSKHFWPAQVAPFHP
jgi:hypothetical protein